MKNFSKIITAGALLAVFVAAPLVAVAEKKGAPAQKTVTTVAPEKPAAVAGETTTAHTTGHAAVDPQQELGKKLPIFSVIPFVIILLAIAILPLVIPHLWESNLVKAVISVLLALVMVGYLATFGQLGFEVIVETLKEYYAFICLLVALFTISGGIYIEGDLKATPLTNTVILAIGASLASFIGTTGASVLLIRPLIRTNQERKYTTHIFVFFILLVSNVGGVLLPVGDPPLFMGYLYGVPFFWTLFKLVPIWLTAVVILLLIFFVWDMLAYNKENKADLAKDASHQTKLRIQGGINFLLIGGVLAAVVFLKDYKFEHGEMALGWLQQPVMLGLALVSFVIDHHNKKQKLKHQEEQIFAKLEKEGKPVTNMRLLAQNHHFTPRDKNHFGFAPIIEVAALFIGIFITMIPALCLLKARGAETGVTQPWQFYWITGALSSFLDNAPSYATFFALGQGVTANMGAAAGAVIHAATGAINETILVAISVGAVFFGANTYIGNAPNFMVKAMCEESKIKMPSFFGYMAYTIVILVPVLALVHFIFLR
ncbi:MAG: sodium:proton antiporter [Spirochaetes bacterium]|nr:sodium:proton antiporter [Spirochaetota bacterium]